LEYRDPSSVLIDGYQMMVPTGKLTILWQSNTSFGCFSNLFILVSLLLDHGDFGLLCDSTTGLFAHVGGALFFCSSKN